jgi:pimeloyl-ACP methyl ester carboxylesterase
MLELGVEFWRQRRIQSLFWGQNLGLLDSATEDIIRCATLPSLMPGWDRAIKDFTRSGGYYFLRERIRRIDKPTLILWGERDDVLGTEAAEQFVSAIANSRLVWLQGLGHSPQWEQPELVAARILEFID